MYITGWNQNSVVRSIIIIYERNQNFSHGFPLYFSAIFCFLFIFLSLYVNTVNDYILCKYIPDASNPSIDNKIYRGTEVLSPNNKNSIRIIHILSGNAFRPVCLLCQILKTCCRRRCPGPVIWRRAGIPRMVIILPNPRVFMYV